jgi:Predicted membrane protein (DUF2207)
MQSDSAVPAVLYFNAWIVLAILLLYYTTLVLVFRVSRAQRAVAVVQYEPPKHISPAVAAYLTEDGLYERAFASALVSLSRQGFLELGQDRDRFRLKKLREPDSSLTPEESLILSSLFFSSQETYAFDSVEYSRLCRAYSDFRMVLDDIVAPSLVSHNLLFWLFGVLISFLAILPIVMAIGSSATGTSMASMAYFSIWIFIGGSCLIAALRVWPATIHKLTSYIPWDDRPSRPLEVNDAIPIFLSASALAGFVFLAVLSSTQFACLVAASVVLCTMFRHRLDMLTPK